jgi:16S rRNA (cytosine967-C5)-methyltransferase
VLADHTGVRLLDASALLPWVEDADSHTLPGALQLWPHRHGTDAMFAAALQVG